MKHVYSSLHPALMGRRKSKRIISREHVMEIVVFILVLILLAKLVHIWITLD